LRPINNEKGTVLVVALIIMGLLAIIGTAIMMTTSIELRIARHEREAKTAFYRAENGRVIAAMAAEAAAWGIDYNDGDPFEGNPNITIEDGGFIMEAFYDPDLVTGSPDLRVQEDGSLSAEVDIDKLSTALLPGASAEFGAGYEGAGGAAGVMTMVRMDSIGTEPTGSSSRVEVEYMLIPR
jgi:hypothetical protein